jgi:predicted adenylyl cyclase CyaB
MFTQNGFKLPLNREKPVKVTMPANIEIKASAIDFSNQLRLAEMLCGKQAERFTQEDTYFPANRGRLKLRRFADGSGELIQYNRENKTSPTPSCYQRVALSDPEALRAALTAAIGVRGVVRKSRTLFLQGQSRLHFDQVENLGEFIEIEVVLRPGQEQAEGEAIADELMKKILIAPEQLISDSYIDLLEAANR